MGVQTFASAATRDSRCETTNLAGLPITTASRAYLVVAVLADHGRALASVGAPRARLVFVDIGHALSLAAQVPVYGEALAAADIIHADGGFLVTLSRFLGGPAIRERSATTDMIHDIAGVAQANGLSFYLLGGSEDVNSACAAQLKELYPGLVIAGRHHGFFKEDDVATLLGDIAACAPDVIWVGLGKPYEQIFARALARSVSATWIVTCGGCFKRFITGGYRRAPRWDAGGESGMAAPHGVGPEAAVLALCRDLAPRRLAHHRTPYRDDPRNPNDACGATPNSAATMTEILVKIPRTRTKTGHSTLSADIIWPSIKLRIST